VEHTPPGKVIADYSQLPGPRLNSDDIADFHASSIGDGARGGKRSIEPVLVTLRGSICTSQSCCEPLLVLPLANICEDIIVDPCCWRVQIVPYSMRGGVMRVQ
jgi:hypothetical protein